MHPRSCGRRATGDQITSRVRTSITKAKELGGKLNSEVGGNHRAPVAAKPPWETWWLRDSLLPHWEVKSSGRVMCNAVGTPGMIIGKGRWDTASSFGPQSQEPSLTHDSKGSQGGRFSLRFVD